LNQLSFGLQELKTKSGKIIFLVMGPVLYFGLWAPILKSVNLNSIATWASFSALYSIVSYVMLKAHEKWIVPRIEDLETYRFFAKFGWFNALCLSVPAAYLGFFSVVIFYGVSARQTQFNFIAALMLFFSGWSVGCFVGAMVCMVALPFLGLFFAGSNEEDFSPE